MPAGVLVCAVSRMCISDWREVVSSLQHACRRSTELQRSTFTVFPYGRSLVRISKYATTLSCHVTSSSFEIISYVAFLRRESNWNACSRTGRNLLSADQKILWRYLLPSNASNNLWILDFMLGLLDNSSGGITINYYNHNLTVLQCTYNFVITLEIFTGWPVFFRRFYSLLPGTAVCRCIPILLTLTGTGLILVI
jgi:hypothetical protein